MEIYLKYIQIQFLFDPCLVPTELTWSAKRVLPQGVRLTYQANSLVG